MARRQVLPASTIAAASVRLGATRASFRQVTSIGTLTASPEATVMVPTMSLPAASRANSTWTVSPPGRLSVSPSSWTSRQNGPMFTHSLQAPGAVGRSGTFAAAPP